MQPSAGPGWCHGPGMPGLGCQAHDAQPQGPCPQSAARGDRPAPTPTATAFAGLRCLGQQLLLLGPPSANPRVWGVPQAVLSEGIQVIHHVSTVGAGGSDLHCGSCHLEWPELMVLRCSRP